MSDEQYPNLEQPHAHPHVPNVTTASGPSELAAPAGSAASPFEAPCIIAWRKATRNEWAAHNKANELMLKVACERPRRPWHKLRQQRAMLEYERTLNAIPAPPEEEARAWAKQQNAQAHRSAPGGEVERKEKP